MRNPTPSRGANAWPQGVPGGRGYGRFGNPGAPLGFGQVGVIRFGFQGLAPLATFLGSSGADQKGGTWRETKRLGLWRGRRVRPEGGTIEAKSFA
jgi:hypothetical protein